MKKMVKNEGTVEMHSSQPPITSTLTKTAGYDDLVFDIVGEFGPAQWLVFGFVWLNAFLGLDPVHMVFIGADMNHWCRVPLSSAAANLSVERQLYVGVPRTGPDDTGPYSSCLLFDVNWTHVDTEQLDVWNRSERIASGLKTVACSDWIYDQTNFRSTIVKRVGSRN
jgi:hypothetical protein